MVIADVCLAFVDRRSDRRYASSMRWGASCAQAPAHGHEERPAPIAAQYSGRSGRRSRAGRLPRCVGVAVFAAALASACTAPTALAGNRVYWANRFTTNTISFANFDESGGGDLAATGATGKGPFGVALDPASGRAYWPGFETNTISFSNLDGTGGGNITTGAATVSGPTGVAVDIAAGRI